MRTRPFCWFQFVGQWTFRCSVFLSASLSMTCLKQLLFPLSVGSFPSEMTQNGSGELRVSTDLLHECVFSALDHLLLLVLNTFPPKS